MLPVSDLGQYSKDTYQVVEKNPDEKYYFVIEKKFFKKFQNRKFSKSKIFKSKISKSKIFKSNIFKSNIFKNPNSQIENFQNRKFQNRKFSKYFFDFCLDDKIFATLRSWAMIFCAFQTCHVDTQRWRTRPLWLVQERQYWVHGRRSCRWFANRTAITVTADHGYRPAIHPVLTLCVPQYLTVMLGDGTFILDYNNMQGHSEFWEDVGGPWPPKFWRNRPWPSKYL